MKWSEEGRGALRSLCRTVILGLGQVDMGRRREGTYRSGHFIG
jgi:hypothetical protein